MLSDDENKEPVDADNVSSRGCLSMPMQKEGILHGLEDFPPSNFFEQLYISLDVQLPRPESHQMNLCTSCSSSANITLLLLVKEKVGLRKLMTYVRFMTQW